ncbi:Polyphosphate kinase [Budvicia aquatica]|uniref:Polyphosphate kinase n=1 Tax=Budvicia aquatica TaxID=82979 RepID=A0A484ZV83_9GAMM|nr:Polyphosphate kinase [Budvicia aquatica]
MRYAHIGTGNFNEKTARLYTDFSLLTADSRITNEVRRVFNFIENPYRPVSFEHLLVSPQNSRLMLNKLIDREISYAAGWIRRRYYAEINNLVDKELIDRLYAASGAGVRIRLIVRGMCSLVPNIPGVSENIQVISIVDRYFRTRPCLYL